MKVSGIAVLLLLTALQAGAQTTEGLVAEGDKLDGQQQTEAALKVYLEAEKQEAASPALLIKIAKQYGESMTDLRTDDQKKKAGELALDYAQRAFRLAPQMSDAALAVAICYGRLLNLVPVRTRVEYSRFVHDFAQKAIALNPDSDYAWHMMGRWNQAVATMGPFTKGIVNLVYGGLPDATLEESKRCFEKALKIKNDRVSHHIELGCTLAFMGQKDEARMQIERGLAMPNRERDDPQTKERGRQALKTL